MKLPGPRCVQIETVNFCNAHCWFCPVHRMKRPKMMMTNALLERVFKELGDNPPQVVYPFLNGEPFLDTRMVYLLKELAKLPSEVVLFTNGSLLQPRISKQILECVPNLKEIWWSLNVAPKLTRTSNSLSMKIGFEARMGFKWITVRKNLRTFLDLKKQYEHPVKVVVSYVGLSEEGIIKVRTHWKNYPVTVFFSPVKNWAGAIRGHPDTNRRISHSCPRVFQYLNILADGHVSLCCMDVEGTVVLGDLNEQTIEEIWNGEKHMSYVKAHYEGRWNELPLCSNCTGA